MFKTQYILAPIVGHAKADKSDPRLLACGIVRACYAPDGEVLLEDRSVAIAPDDIHGVDRLAEMMAAALYEPLPIIGWQILPILLPQLRTFLESISPEPSLALSEAMVACCRLGTHDPAIAMGGAIDALISNPAKEKTGIDDFYEMSVPQQITALCQLGKADCEALWQLVANKCGEKTIG